MRCKKLEGSGYEIEKVSIVENLCFHYYYYFFAFVVSCVVVVVFWFFGFCLFRTGASLGLSFFFVSIFCRFLFHFFSFVNFLCHFFSNVTPPML